MFRDAVHVVGRGEGDVQSDRQWAAGHGVEVSPEVLPGAGHGALEGPFFLPAAICIQRQTVLAIVHHLLATMAVGFGQLCPGSLSPGAPRTVLLLEVHEIAIIQHNRQHVLVEDLDTERTVLQDQHVTGAGLALMVRGREGVGREARRILSAPSSWQLVISSDGFEGGQICTRRKQQICGLPSWCHLRDFHSHTASFQERNFQIEWG